MPYNLLLVPLLGGFLFLHLTHSFRFRAQRLDGYRLLMESALAGAMLLFLSRIAIIAVEGTRPGSWVASHWTWLVPFEYSGTTVVSLFLGALLAVVVNQFLPRAKAKDRVMRNHGNALLKLLHNAESRNLVVSVTLDSRKWYVGFIAESPNLSQDENFFRLLPVFSGYRDKDTLQTVRTVFYEEWMQDASIKRDDFVITIPIKDVKVANLFDLKLYEKLEAEASTLLADPHEPEIPAPQPLPPEAPPK